MSIYCLKCRKKCQLHRFYGKVFYGKFCKVYIYILSLQNKSNSSRETVCAVIKFCKKWIFINLAM